MSRKELYKQGYFFLRRRERTLSWNQECFNKNTGTFGLFISQEFGSWKLVEWYDDADEREIAIERWKADYDKIIVEE